MPIFFSVVASEKVILAKFASCEGNFSEMSDQLLSKIPSQNEKVTYFHGPYLFHYIAENHHVYFCITDKTCQRSRAFLFLNQIKRRLGAEGGTGLSQVLADEMHRYSEDCSTIVIHEGELDELNKIGVRSSEDILGETLLYVENKENVNYSTITYVRKTPEEVTIHSNNTESILNNQIIINTNNIDTSKKETEEPVSTYKSGICISYDGISLSKSRVRIIIAMFLLGLAICVLDFMPLGHVVVLILVVIFVLLK